MKTPPFLFCVFAAVGALSAQTPVSTPLPVALSPEQTQVILERSLVSAGDASRLKRVFAKGERGEKLVVGVIGGSITQGAKATKAEKRYPNVVAQWWRKNFPKAEVTLVNAGIGATGSNYGALRAQRDLLSKNPDFVIVEYAVNDSNEQARAVTLEGLVRQILKAPSAPAVMLLFMTKKDGTNAQEWHSKVGAHYHLPMVSFRDGIWPGCKSGEFKIEDFLADEVHPNDFGHGVTAACVAHLLDEARKADASGSKTDPLPAPLFSAEYESTTLQEAPDLKPVANQGWTFQDGPKGKSWHAEEPGSVIEFEIKGSSILFMSHVIRGAMGRAEVRVDDLPPKTIDGWFPGTWGGYRLTTAIGEGLDAKATHRVRVKLLEEKSPESTGHGFSIFGLGAAGVP
jgi:lysophospholipase L1-like esterase